jgi:hypothetical protein
MPNYQNAKIYKVYCVGGTDNLCYIGSTCKDLSERFYNHKYKYRTGIYKSINKIFDRFGLDKCVIELIELYPCEFKEDLIKREGFFIKSMNTVNDNMAGRTRDEWVTDNANHLRDKHKEYYNMNRDKLLEKSKQFYINNREHILEYQKQYRQNNIEYLKSYDKKRKSVRYTCVCGDEMNISYKSRHERTIKHKKFLDETDKKKTN